MTQVRLQSDYAIGLPNGMSIGKHAPSGDLLVMVISRNMLVIMGNTANGVENSEFMCLQNGK